MPQWTLVCMYLFGPRFSLDTCPGVELLNHLATLFFNFLSSLHTILHSGYTNLHIHQQRREFPFLHTLSIIYLWFLMMTILISVKWYLIIVLICISLIISNDEQFFMCLFRRCFLRLFFLLIWLLYSKHICGSI